MKLALLLALGVATQAPLVTTTLSSESVATGELFELEIRVETSGAAVEIVLAGLPAGLEIVQTGKSDAFQSRFPSGRSRVVTASFGMVSRVPGTFLLPIAKVRVEGREYPSRALAITVRSPGPGSVSTQSNPPRLEIAVEPTQAWVGQAVLLKADAMFPRDIRSRLTRPATYEPPAAPGFWVVDLPNPMTLQLERIGDDVFEVQTYRRVYVPIIPGTHALAPARLSYEIRTGLLQPPQSLMVESDSVLLEVLPLPAEGRPASFAGAVGTYSIRAQVEPAEVAVGEAASVTVEIRGRGDVRGLPAPALDLGADLEVLPPVEETEEDYSGTGIGGRKTFTWAIIPNNPGPLVIGPIEFAWFDTEARDYRVAQSDSLVLQVAQFTGSEEAQGLRPVDTTPTPSSLDFVRTPAFAILQTIPALLLLLGWLRARRSAPSGKRDRRQSDRTDHAAAIDRLKAAAKRTEAGVADELAALLRAALHDLGGKGPDPAGVEAGQGDPARAREIAVLLDTVERARFGAESAPDLTSLLEQAERLLAGLSSSRTRQLRVSSALLLPILLGTFLNTQANPQTHAFDRGVAALAARDARAARDAFEEHLENRPGDASAWYNLGNAAYRDGDRGAATHAWLESLSLEPRRADARNNMLSVAGSGVARLLPSRLGFSADAALFLTALAWWLCVLAVLLFPRRIRWPAVGAAVLLTAAAWTGWLLTRSVADLATVRSDGTAIRSEPALQSDAIRPFLAGEPLEIETRNGDWVRVRTAAGDVGWVEAISLRFVTHE